MTKSLQYITILLFALASVWMGCRNEVREKNVGRFEDFVQDTVMVGNYTDDSFRTAFASFIDSIHAKGWKDSQLIFLGGYGTSDNASKTSVRWAKVIEEAMRKQDSLYPDSVYFNQHYR